MKNSSVEIWIPHEKVTDYSRRVGSYDLFFLTRTVTFVVLNSTKLEAKAIVSQKRHLDDINQTK